MYTMSDAHRSFWAKPDLVYLIAKYGVKSDGKRPTRAELECVGQPGLAAVWSRIRPFDFGKDPQEVAA